MVEVQTQHALELEVAGLLARSSSATGSWSGSAPSDDSDDDDDDEVFDADTPKGSLTPEKALDSKSVSPKNKPEGGRAAGTPTGKATLVGKQHNLARRVLLSESPTTAPAGKTKAGSGGGRQRGGSNSIATARYTPLYPAGGGDRIDAALKALFPEHVLG